MDQASMHYFRAHHSYIIGCDLKKTAPRQQGRRERRAVDPLALKQKQVTMRYWQLNKLLLLRRPLKKLLLELNKPRL